MSGFVLPWGAQPSPLEHGEEEDALWFITINIIIVITHTVCLFGRQEYRLQP